MNMCSVWSVAFFVGALVRPHVEARVPDGWQSEHAMEDDYDYDVTSASDSVVQFARALLAGEGEGEGEADGAGGDGATPSPTTPAADPATPAPTSLSEGECAGNDSRCKSSHQATCLRLSKQGADCKWNDAELNSKSAGTCLGNDSRCSSSMAEECRSLETEGADCKWRAAFSVTGSLVMAVKDVQTFVSNPDAKFAIREGLANITGVPSEYIEVDVIAQSRRLRTRMLSQSGNLLVTYAIVVRGDAPETVDVTGVEVGEKLLASNLEHVQVAVSTSIENAFGSEVFLSIESLVAPDVVEESAPTSGPSTPTPAPVPPTPAGTIPPTPATPSPTQSSTSPSTQVPPTPTPPGSIPPTPATPSPTQASTSLSTQVSPTPASSSEDSSPTPNPTSSTPTPEPASTATTTSTTAIASASSSTTSSGSAGSEQDLTEMDSDSASRVFGFFTPGVVTLLMITLS